MTVFYQALKAQLIALLIFAFTFAYSQEQPIDKSEEIQNTEDQSIQNLNELPTPSATATQMSLKIEQSVAQTKTDTKQQYKKKENDWLTRLLADPIAIFTFLLVLATFALWWATRRLVIGAEQTAHRQLRAYVSIKHDEKMFCSDNGSLVAPVIVKNHGNTPAHSLVCCVYICLHKWPLEIELDSSVFAENASQTTLAPGEQIRQYAELPRELNQQEIKAITQQSGAIVVWGEVRYTDAFGKLRKTSLCLYSTGNDFSRGELAYHHYGNDSD